MSDQYFVLDNTLRHLYITLRNAGASILAIEFVHRGKKWKCDTAEEAIRLRQQLEIEDAREKGTDWLDDLDARDWTPAVFETFLDTIGDQQTDAVRFMFEHVGISSANLAKHLKLDNELRLAGVISGLSKQLKSLDLEADDLYTVKTIWNGKKKERFFFLRDNFRRAAEEVGWAKEKGKHAASTTRHK